jgi:hypothetical protein
LLTQSFHSIAIFSLQDPPPPLDAAASATTTEGEDDSELVLAPNGDEDEAQRAAAGVAALPAPWVAMDGGNHVGSVSAAGGGQTAPVDSNVPTTADAKCTFRDCVVV